MTLPFFILHRHFVSENIMSKITLNSFLNFLWYKTCKLHIYVCITICYSYTFIHMYIYINTEEPDGLQSMGLLS